MGSYQKVLKLYGLKLKYESWMDMRRALGISKYGTWPR